MIINHNLAALNTYNRLSANNASASKSLEKLSSGLRINRAGDDAAGLAISEKMRGQIRGLDQASSNAQNGISLIQTAEGALTETHSILQRMRELAVQSANDTNTDSDRAEIQKEVEQLKSEITRISTDTEFNTKKLLDGSIGISSRVTLNSSNVISINAVGSSVGDGTYQFIVSSAANAITVDQAATGIDAADDIATIGAAAILGQYTINVTANDGTNATVEIKDRYGASLGTTTGVIADGITVGTGGNTIAIASGAITANATGTSKVTIEKSATMTVLNGSVTVNTPTAFTSKDGKFTVNNGNFEMVVDGDFADTTSTTVANSTVVDSKALTFQIGANANQNMNLAVSQMDASSLGVSGIDLSTQTGANSAITTIQTAIEKVSSERAKLGAVQNRLEHTINNVQTASENITSAESRIRDVDMAKEMMNYQKNSILQQAATSMLAQANQQPQNVLKLLQ